MNKHRHRWVVCVDSCCNGAQKWCEECGGMRPATLVTRLSLLPVVWRFYFFYRWRRWP